MLAGKTMIAEDTTYRRTNPRINLHPFVAAAKAMPIPVFPEVGSIKVSPCFSRPDFSASSTMRFPIRSLTDPPALKNSHLATISHLTSLAVVILLIRTIGVSPITSKMELQIVLERSIIPVAPFVVVGVVVVVVLVLVSFVALVIFVRFASCHFQFSHVAFGYVTRKFNLRSKNVCRFDLFQQEAQHKVLSIVID